MCSNQVGTVDEVDEPVDEPVEEPAGADGWGPWQRLVQVFPFEPDEPGLPGVPDGVLLARLRHAEALLAQVLVEQSRALVELRRRRLVGQAAAHPHEGGVCLRACCDDDGWVGAEVGPQLGLSEGQVQSRIVTGLRLARYGVVAGALADGAVQAWTATKLVEHLDTLAAYLTPARLAAVEAQTVAWLTSGLPRTVGQLNARMRRLVLAARAAAERHDPTGPHSDPEPGPDPGVAGRRVWVGPSGTPGVAELVAVLPEADAVAVRATLLALAHDRADPQDPRTAGQRRADLLVTLVTGRVAGHGRPADTRCAGHGPIPVQVQLQVSLPADSLSGGTTPGWVPGYGDIPASTARTLAAAATTAAGPAGAGACAVRPLVIDPASGRLLGFAASPVRMTWLAGLEPGRAYQHPPGVEAAIRWRDGTCRAPGCRRPAARCDCDHVVPYPAGETSLGNGCCLCRRHHRLKTHAPGWALSLDPDTARATWTTPTGRRYTTDPTDYRPPDLPPEPPPDLPPDPALDVPPDPVLDVPPF
jgi:hypothetical protein